MTGFIILLLVLFAVLIGWMVRQSRNPSKGHTGHHGDSGFVDAGGDCGGGGDWGGDCGGGDGGGGDGGGGGD